MKARPPRSWLLAGAGLCLACMAATAAGEDAAQDDDGQLCVNAQFGAERPPPLDCLNRALAREVRQQTDRKALLQATIDQAQPSAPTQFGLYNQTATRERLGPNFGHSVQPWRAPQVFVDPVLSGRTPH